jgi:hypothetical protein
VDAYYDAIKQTTMKIMSLDAASMRTYAPKAVEIAEKSKIDINTSTGLERLKKALVQEYIISE